MSRRLIIIILIILIVSVLAGTVTLIVRSVRQNSNISDTETGDQPGQLDLAPEGRPEIANPEGDDDADGLTNALEAVWGTNPNLSDTDGDGFKDGEEVAANHNPTIAGPNDLLPAGFKPQQNLQPLAAAPLQIDEFFEDGLDLTGGNTNLTEAYDQKTPDKEKSVASMFAYAQDQPIITKLPAAKDSGILKASSDDANAVATYLNTASNYDAISNSVLFNTAMNGLIQTGNPSGIQNVATQVRIFQEKLLTLPVPNQALSLHKVLIGYTELLAATFDQIALWNTDRVKALTAIRQLDTIDRQYYPIIVNEINRLSQ